MRSVKLSQDDVQKIRELYEGVMSYACHGLFTREGTIIGRNVAEQALVEKERYFEKAAEILKDSGWVETIEFGSNKVVVKGSIEIANGDGPTCDRLKGILRELYERKSSTRFNCLEEECASNGKESCVFRIDSA